MKNVIIGVVVFVVAFACGVFTGNKVATQRSQAEITKIKGDTEIYRAESERLAGILRSIRQAAAQATVVEQAK